MTTTGPMKLEHTSQALDARCLLVEIEVSFAMPHSQEVNPTHLRKLGCPVEVVVCPAGPEPAESAEGSPGGPGGELGDPLPEVFVSVDMSSIEVVMMQDGPRVGRAQCCPEWQQCKSSSATPRGDGLP